MEKAYKNMDVSTYKTMVSEYCPVIGKQVGLTMIKRMEGTRAVCVHLSCSAKLQCTAADAASGDCLLKRNW